jgi:uncharacterized protein (DUF2236 family)
VSRISEPIRARLQTTLSGQPAGVPAWITALEDGEDEGHFGPGSAAWAVHGDLPTLVAGIRALLTQALHPGAMAGVHDHSRYRDDPFGRLAGTIRWIMTVTYGSTADAATASDWVLRLHERVRGEYLGEHGPIAYAANDPELLRWVHLAFTDAFLSAHELWGRPIPGGADAYVNDWATAGLLMQVTDPPRTRQELQDQLRSYAPVLHYDDRVADVVRFLRRPPLAPLLRPTYPLLFQGAVASLPDDLRELLRLPRAPRGTVPAARVVLKATGRVLGTRSGAETAALRRRARLEAARATRSA